ncbi:MAG: sulfatase-like hydrolase/transferase [Planctomycetota bacterium]|nr:sulfatase-like hydrolase/transferase [Planctomycetota bacterium]
MERPNFLFILTDQQRADTLGAYGCAVGATPNLDRLAAGGVTCARAYCNNPLCMPSRASLLTGRYPHASGVRTNGCAPRSGQALLPDLLSRAGYRTAAFGKVHYHPVRAEPEGYWPENQHVIASGEDLTRPYLGFHEIALGCGHGDVMPGLHTRELQARHPEVLERRGPRGALRTPDTALKETRGLNTYQTSVPLEHYPTTWVTDRTVEYLMRAEEPFFLWCGLNDPHHPFCPPGPYWDRFKPEEMPAPRKRAGELDAMPPHFKAVYEGRYRDRDTDGFMWGSEPYLSEENVRLMAAAYYGMIALIDDSVARMLDALERRGLRENTVVVFASDHGELLGDHGLILKGPYQYESSLRVPFVWNAPRRLPACGVVRRPVGLVDFMPTILELAGVECPAGVQGRSLVEALGGLDASDEGEAYVENDVDALGLRMRTLVTERWKITAYANPEHGELFDLENDPDEFENLWDRGDPKVKQALLRRLAAAMIRNQDPLPAKTCHA